MGSLPWTRHCSRGTQVWVIRVYPPAGASACGGVATPAVSSDTIHNVSRDHLGEVLGKPHVDADRAAQISPGDVAGVAQGDGSIWGQRRSPGERGANIHKVRPVGPVSTAPRATR